MAKKTLKMPSLSRVTPGSTATLELPVGATYEKIIFDVTAGAGLDATDIGRIDVLINGKVVQTYKNLQRLMDINSFYNREVDTMSATAAQFALHFNRAELEGLAYRRAPGIGTADVDTFHIEVTLAAAAPADIAIKAHAHIDPAPQPLGVFMKITEFPYNSAVSGQVEIDKLPRAAWYSAIHLFKADVSSTIVEADLTKVIDATKAVLERVQKGASPVKRVPITGSATHIDFCVDGDLAQALRTQLLKDFRVKMTLDTAGAVDIITETLDSL